MDYMEKYIDLTEQGAIPDINRYIANGWYIHYSGITLIVLRKPVAEMEI
jgi:hypothetical protein